jgi:hypothetical protein
VRLNDIRTGLLAIVERVDAIDTGYRLHLPNTDETTESVLDFVRFERQCCPFLSFGVTLPAEPLPIHLELTGTENAQEFIRVTFIENVTPGNTPT